MENIKVYKGEGDLASFTFAFSETDSYTVLCNTLKHKHVRGVKDGEEIDFVWFEDEYAG